MISFNLALSYGLSAMAVVSAMGVVLVRNTIYSAISLILCFISMAGIWALMQSPFLAVLLILVYVGAIMVLFLFVIMMIEPQQKKQKSIYGLYSLFGALVIMVLAGSLLYLYHELPLAVTETLEANPKKLGYILYTLYLYPIEITGMLLLSALVCAICLSPVRRGLRRIVQDNRWVDASKSKRLTLIDSQAKGVQCD